MLGEETMGTSSYIRVAIDGPAAAGKSTVARQLAKRLSFVYIDTGAMYRAITLKALQSKININNEAQLVDLLHNTNIELQNIDHKQVVLLDGVDVSDEIRNNDVSKAVSYVAQHKEIRTEMLFRQRQLAENKNVIMDGRDIGTNVLPQAELKIYLKASVDERAKRRHEENKQKGIVSNLQTLQKEIADRDKRDMTRKVAPLKKAQNAIIIDTTNLTVKDVVDKIFTEVKKIRKEKKSNNT